MKKLLKLSVLAIISVFAFACVEMNKNIEDDRFFDVPNQDHESVIQEGVIKLENKYIDWARRFPGLVPDSIYRYVDGVDVTIDMNYTPTSSVFRHSHYNAGQRPYFSTGFYAPPAEVITVTRPAGSPNVRVVIGLSDNISTGTSTSPVRMNRYPNVNTSATFEGESTTLTIYNYFGGPIFIQPLTAASNIGEYTYNFKGVVKPASFVKGKTDIWEWYNQLDTIQVPMIEIITDYFVWQMPLNDARAAKRSGGLNLESFARLIDWYDDVFQHDYFDYCGLVTDDPTSIHRAPDFKLRAMADVQISAGAAHSGYPAMFGGSTYSTRGMQYDIMSACDGNAWGFFHEFGHNFQQSSWVWGTGGAHEVELEGNIGINEVSCNFHIFHAGIRTLGRWVDNDGLFKATAENFAAAPDDGYKNFGLTEADITYTDLAVPINAGNHARITPFMQLAQKYGFRLFAYIYQETRKLTSSEYTQIASTGTTDAERANRRRSFFILRACEYAQTDLRPFFDDWGMKYSRALGNVIGQKFSTKLDRDNDPWWHTFNYSLLPSFESKEIPESGKIANSYIWTTLSGDLVRENWVVTETAPEPTADGATGNITAHLFDGLGTTYLALAKPTRGNNTTGGPNGTGVDPYFIVDIGADPAFFNYVNVRHRSAGNTNAMLRVWEFSIYGSNDGVNFTLIKSGIAPNRTNNEVQKFSFGVDASYRYVKMQYTDWDRVNFGNSIQLSEFGLGYDD